QPPRHARLHDVNVAAAGIVTDAEPVLDPQPGGRTRLAFGNEQEVDVGPDLGERFLDDPLEAGSGHGRSPIACASEPEMRFAASPITSSDRWAYLAVVSGRTWPSSLPMVASGTLSMIAVEAKLWRRSWMRTSGKAQRRRNASHQLSRLSGFSPVQSGKTNGESSRRPTPASTSSAWLLSQIVLAPV